MSCSYRLSLPTDIPWKRLCVSQDMLDPFPCDMEYPPKFNSSLVVFRYDPEEEYQPFEDGVVTYLKIVATVAPYAPDVSINTVGEYVPPVLVADLQESFPCYGAILQVSVFPHKEDLNRFPKSRYPYFSDFEPKKRELYEAVTETGEILSGSSTSLVVGKSGMAADTVENYNLDTGWNFGMQASFAGTGGGLDVGETGQWGTINRSQRQRSDTRTSDESVERRERQSHVTQLSQMYNLFQAFHLGTNRAVFLMEPRPHIRQSEATFINGPRALEGMQEIFLVVVRPKEMDDFCVFALLETAHLTKKPVYEYEKDDTVLPFRLEAIAQNKDDGGKTSWVEAKSHTETFEPPQGWEIDTSKGKGGYDYKVLRRNRVQKGPVITATRNSLSVYGEVTWRFWEQGGTWLTGYDNHYEDGYLDVDVTIYLKKKEPIMKEYVRKLYFAARDLCCCPDPPISKAPWISRVTSIRPQVKVAAGYPDHQTLMESRLIAGSIKEEMRKTVAGHGREKRGATPYEESDAFFTRVADLLHLYRCSDELRKPVEESSTMPEEARSSVHRALGSIDLVDVLDMDTSRLACYVGSSEEEAREIKKATLRALASQAIAASRRRAEPEEKTSSRTREAKRDG